MKVPITYISVGSFILCPRLAEMSVQIDPCDVSGNKWLMSTRRPGRRVAFEHFFKLMGDFTVFQLLKFLKQGRLFFVEMGRCFHIYLNQLITPAAVAQRGDTFTPKPKQRPRLGPFGDS